ncbi:hypothetical protein FZW96_21610 [Bacillus sp. BGMRC 2118]|nr:hypothetical protein FZW96_21610 [Bacillus sp. BGMRC 2118]
MNFFNRHRKNQLKVEDKNFAESALKKMFIGSVVDGIKFEVAPGRTLIFFMHYTQNLYDFDSIWLNIENSKWAVYDGEDKIPVSLDDIVNQTEEEGYYSIFNIRREEVLDIRLGDTSPHLFITFKSGKVLFVCGYHEKYESWQASNGLHESGEWLIVAVPENQISSWTP